MLNLLGHGGAPLRPHDVVWAWNLDPMLLVLFGTVAIAYRRGRRDTTDPRWQRISFWSGLGVVAVALVSPLDALSEVLASAHMVQHVLLLVVGAPLLAVAAPGAALLRGTPAGATRRIRTLRRGVALDAARLRRARAPVARWLAYVIVLWVWHASVLYGAAVEYELIHIVEHVSFLGAGLLVWTSILGPARVRVPRELGVLGVFVLGLQSVFLSVLLTFSTSPWYEPYIDAAPGWGIDPLADQQLAGVVMWVPAGLVHAGIGIALLAAWLRDIDRAPDPGGRPVVSARTS